MKKTNIIPEYFDSENWLTQINGSIAHSVQNYGVVIDKQTDYQNVKITDTVDYGRCVYCNGVLMYNTESYIINEMLVHPTMNSHHAPRQVLIIGGASGGVLKEVLKYSIVAEVFVIEQDKTLCDIYASYLADTQLPFKDSRVKIFNIDPKEYIQKCPSMAFDIIIVDNLLTNGYVDYLYSNEFYNDAKKLLKTDGAIVSTIGYMRDNKEQIINCYNLLLTCFENKTQFYSVDTLLGNLGFMYAVKNSTNSFATPDTAVNTEYDNIISTTEYFNSQMHQKAFMHPRWMQSIIDTARGSVNNGNIIHTKYKHKPQ